MRYMNKVEQLGDFIISLKNLGNVKNFEEEAKKYSDPDKNLFELSVLMQFAKNGPEFYEYVISSIEENHKTSHAYLIETNGYKEGEKLVLSFVKFLFCQNLDNSSTKECDTCNICNLIDYNTFPDLKIIRPNGLQIKKEQIKELEDEFKTMPEGHNRIYVIMNADTLNASAANAILKFLEEPSPGIIGIFVTQNRYKMMNTISVSYTHLTLPTIA